MSTESFSRTYPEPRLIVNGVDITEENYVYIDHEAFNAHIPVTAVFQALGYNAEFRYDETTDSYAIIIDNSIILMDTREEDFGWYIPNGVESCIRQISENDLIVDTQSLITRMYWMWNARIMVDYKEATINIKTVDPHTFNPYEFSEYPCSVVVNGKKITKDNQYHIRVYPDFIDAELPMLAIVKELGGKVRHRGDIYILKSVKGEYTFDISKPDFGVYFSPYIPTSIRKEIGNELVFDSHSLELILQDLFDIEIIIDSEAYIIYINSI